MLILPDVDLTLFITFITSKTSSIKIWFVLTAGLDPGGLLPELDPGGLSPALCDSTN